MNKQRVILLLFSLILASCGGNWGGTSDGKLRANVVPPDQSPVVPQGSYKLPKQREDYAKWAKRQNKVNDKIDGIVRSKVERNY